MFELVFCRRMETNMKEKNMSKKKIVTTRRTEALSAVQ